MAVTTGLVVGIAITLAVVFFVFCTIILILVLRARQKRLLALAQNHHGFRQPVYEDLSRRKLLHPPLAHTRNRPIVASPKNQPGRQPADSYSPSQSLLADGDENGSRKNRKHSRFSLSFPPKRSMTMPIPLTQIGGQLSPVREIPLSRSASNPSLNQIFELSAGEINCNISGMIERPSQRTFNGRISGEATSPNGNQISDIRIRPQGPRERTPAKTLPVSRSLRSVTSTLDSTSGSKNGLPVKSLHGPRSIRVRSQDSGRIPSTPVPMIPTPSKRMQPPFYGRTSCASLESAGSSVLQITCPSPGTKTSVNTQFSSATSPLSSRTSERASVLDSGDIWDIPPTRGLTVSNKRLSNGRKHRQVSFQVTIEDDSGGKHTPDHRLPRSGSSRVSLAAVGKNEDQNHTALYQESKARRLSDRSSQSSGGVSLLCVSPLQLRKGSLDLQAISRAPSLRDRDCSTSPSRRSTITSSAHHSMHSKDTLGAADYSLGIRPLKPALRSISGNQLTPTQTFRQSIATIANSDPSHARSRSLPRPMKSATGSRLGHRRQKSIHGAMFTPTPVMRSALQEETTPPSACISDMTLSPLDVPQTPFPSPEHQVHAYNSAHIPYSPPTYSVGSFQSSVLTPSEVAFHNYHRGQVPRDFSNGSSIWSSPSTLAPSTITRSNSLFGPSTAVRTTSSIQDSQRSRNPLSSFPRRDQEAPPDQHQLSCSTSSLARDFSFPSSTTSDLPTFTAPVPPRSFSKASLLPRHASRSRYRIGTHSLTRPLRNSAPPTVSISASTSTTDSRERATCIRGPRPLPPRRDSALRDSILALRRMNSEVEPESRGAGARYLRLGAGGGLPSSPATVLGLLQGDADEEEEESVYESVWVGSPDLKQQEDTSASVNGNGKKIVWRGIVDDSPTPVGRVGLGVGSLPRETF